MVEAHKFGVSRARVLKDSMLYGDIGAKGA